MTGFESTATYPVWHDSATQQTAFETAPAHAEVDIAIVGAGLSGLWTAYYLSAAQPSLRIAIVEARHVGFGASGRNGGWCSGFFPLSVSELASVYGRDAALLAYQESFATLPEIEQVLRREGIDCSWHQGGTVQSATTALQAERLQSALEQQHASGLGAGDARGAAAGRPAPPARRPRDRTLRPGTCCSWPSTQCASRENLRPRGWPSA